MLPGYMKGIEQAGGIPLMIPLTSNEENLQQLADEIDGFLYTGG
jgi:Predicted glutamine amidotransferases